MKKHKLVYGEQLNTSNSNFYKISTHSLCFQDWIHMDAVSI